MPTLCAYVYVHVLMFECVCERHHAHITVERLPRQLLPRCLQCHLEYGRRRINTCPIFPQSPPIRIGPRTSTGSVAAGWHGLALLQLLPLVSNKHMISLWCNDVADDVFWCMELYKTKTNTKHRTEGRCPNNNIALQISFAAHLQVYPFGPCFLRFTVHKCQ